METIYQIPPAKLALHPALARVALVPDAASALLEDPSHDPKRRERGEDLRSDWVAWAEEIRKNGVREALTVVAKGDGYLVIDGRHRFLVAQAVGLETVPCRLAKESALPFIAVGTVTGRRHWTKSQRAWFAVLLHPEVAAEDRKAGRPSKSRTECAISLDLLAMRFGVSARLLDLAVELYRGLEKYSHLRPRYEPSLWGGASLAGLVQGLTAETHPDNPTGPGVPIARHPVSKLRNIWISERAHTAHWESADDATRQVLAADLRTEVAKLPEDYLDWKLAILKASLAERRKSESAVPAPLPVA